MDMNKDRNTSNDLSQYTKEFGKLQVIAYKDMVINGVCLRNLGIYYMDSAPDWGVKNHKHSFFELHYVLHGYTYTTINHVERRINAGYFYLMPPGTYHSHRQDSQEGHFGFALRWEFIKLDLKPAFRDSSSELEEMGKLLLNASTLPVEDPGNIINQMIHLLD